MHPCLLSAYPSPRGGSCDPCPTCTRSLSLVLSLPQSRLQQFGLPRVLDPPPYPSFSPHGGLRSSPTSPKPKPRPSSKALTSCSTEKREQSLPDGAPQTPLSQLRFIFIPDLCDFSVGKDLSPTAKPGAFLPGDSGYYHQPTPDGPHVILWQLSSAIHNPAQLCILNQTLLLPPTLLHPPQSHLPHRPSQTFCKKDLLQQAPLSIFYLLIKKYIYNVSLQIAKVVCAFWKHSAPPPPTL